MQGLTIVFIPLLKGPAPAAFIAFCTALQFGTEIDIMP
jgi:hypothetical protein